MSFQINVGDNENNNNNTSDIERNVDATASSSEPTTEKVVTGEVVPLYSDPRNKDLDSKFVVRGYQDGAFGIAFLVNLFIVFVLGCIGMARGIPSVEPIPGGNISSNSSDNITNPGHSLAKGTGVGLAFCLPLVCLMLLLVKLSPKKFIYICTAVITGLLFIGSVSLLAAGAVAPGVVMLLFCLLTLLWLYLVRYKIDLAAVLLEVSIDRVFKNWGVIVVAFGTLVVTGFFIIFFYGAFIPTAHEVMILGTATGGQVFLMLWLLLILYWIVQVAVGVSNTVTAGVTATFYFVANESNMPPNPTIASLKRSMTTSFGSICFGALIIAFIQLLRFLVRQAYNNNENSAIACVCVCLIDILERAARWANNYVHCYIAIYGTPFLQSCSSVYDLLKANVFSAIINEDIIGTVITVITLIDSFAIASICGAIYHEAAGAVFFCVFLLCLFIHLTLFSVVEAAVRTLFVCFAEAPSVLEQHEPGLQKKIEMAILISQKNPCTCCDKDDDGSSGGAGTSQETSSPGRPADAGAM